MTHALFDAGIVAHGQPRAPQPSEDDLSAYVAGVQAHLPGLHLGSATLANPGYLEQVLEQAKPGAVIYPFFMSEGYFTRTALPKRLGDADVQVLPPFGLDPALPALVAQAIMQHHGRILIVAHGSAGGRPGPDAATRDFAAQLSGASGRSGIEVAFLEQAPRLPDVLQQMRDAGAPAQICLPFFAMHGDHMRDDVTEELAKGGFDGDLLPVISKLDGVTQMIAQAVKAAI
jgi:sirohydrochlorin ferrochelatase